MTDPTIVEAVLLEVTTSAFPLMLATGVARIFVWGAPGRWHPADATQPCISRVHV